VQFRTFTLMRNAFRAVVRHHLNPCATSVAATEKSMRAFELADPCTSFEINGVWNR